MIEGRAVIEGEAVIEGRADRRSGPRPWAPLLTVVASFFVCVSLIGCDEVVLDFESQSRLPSVEEEGEGGAPPAPEPPISPELLVTGELNLSTASSGDRSCGDAVSYSVLSGVGARLTLAVAPAAGCLEPGDEVLLIQMQAVSDPVDRVGQHELLRVQSLASDAIELVSRPLTPYGQGSKDHWNSEEGQVFLQRVPNYTRLMVESGAVLTASGWGEGGTGTLVVRVLGDAQIDGAVSMNGAGYRGGAERPEPLQHGLSGESIGGMGIESTESNLGGGGGGLGDQETSGCVQDGNAGGGGGHRDAGGDAVLADICGGEGRGRGGGAYAEAGRLFLGSGGGSGGVDNVRVDNPPGAPGGNGGGIVWILAQSVSGTGVIESRGENGVGDEPGLECVAGGSQTQCYDHSGPGGGGAGGSIRLSAAQVSGVHLDVAGGMGGNGYDSAGGDGGPGSPGVILR